jgi:hypothetical protein
MGLLLCYYIVMNIFVLSKYPRLAAEMHCDKHCVKMILETAQMLSTAHRVYNIAEWNWGTPAPDWFERNSEKDLQSAQTVV